MKKLPRASAPLALLASLLAGALSLVGPTVAAAENPLSLAPSNAEFVLQVNAHELLASPLVKSIVEKRFSPEFIDGRVRAIQSLTGVNVREDIQSVHVFGQVDKDKTIIVVVTGSFDEQRLVDLVPLNPSYRTETIAGRTIHLWTDNDDEKFGFAPAKGQVVIAASRGAMEACLNALDHPESSFASTRYAKAFEQRSASTTAWLAIGGLDENSDLGRVAHLLRAESALLTAKLTASDVSLAATLLTESEDDVDSWRDLVEGVVGLGTLQRAEPLVAQLAEAVEVSTDRDLNAVLAEATFANDKVVNLIEERLPMARETRQERRAERRNERSSDPLANN